MQNLIFLLIVSLVSGCGFAPLKYDEVKEGQWKAKALVKDLEQSKSYIVNLNFNAVRDSRLRMDVSSSLGTAVAALTADQKEVKYLLVEAKKFYFGNSRPDAMRPILSIPFDPRWLQNLLFDIPFADKAWACKSDSKGFLNQCVHSELNVKVTWTQRAGEQKTISLEHKRANVQLNILSFKPKVEDRKGLFELKAPASFESLNIR